MPSYRRGVLLTLLGLPIEAIKTRAAQRARDVVHAVVVPDGLVEVLVRLAVARSNLSLAAECIVVARDEPTLARRQVLRRVERVRHRVAKRADPLALPRREVCLGRVVDDLEVGFLRERFDCVDIDRAAIEVRRGDAARLCSSPSLPRPATSIWNVSGLASTKTGVQPRVRRSSTLSRCTTTRGRGSHRPALKSGSYASCSATRAIGARQGVLALRDLGPLVLELLALLGRSGACPT
jgi:hypothetical protein